MIEVCDQYGQAEMPNNMKCVRIHNATNLNQLFRHRRHPLHLVRGPPLAQRLLHLRAVQDLAGGQGLHHRRTGHHLSGVRQAETHVNTHKPSLALPTFALTIQQLTSVQLLMMMTLSGSQRLHGCAAGGQREELGDVAVGQRRRGMSEKVREQSRCSGDRLLLRSALCSRLYFFIQKNDENHKKISTNKYVLSIKYRFASFFTEIYLRFVYIFWLNSLC